MSSKRKSGSSSNPKCDCSAVQIAYVSPESRGIAEEIATHLWFDQKKKLSFFVCPHGNEFPLPKVRG